MKNTMEETIFMIHGMWCGPWCWENYQGFLEARGYRCIAAKLPYHDPAVSTAPDTRLGTTGLLDYAAALEQEIRGMDVTPVLMGHSMGGLLAQILASRGLAKALVLLNPAAPAGIVALTPSVLKSFWTVALQWRSWKRPVLPLFTDAVYAALHLLPGEEQRAVYDRFSYESGRVIAEIGLWPFDRHRAAAVDQDNVTCPVLVVAGAQDRITPASVVRRVARRYGRRTTYREFKDHAHWTLGEPGWQDVATTAVDWLNEALGVRRAPR